MSGDDDTTLIADGYITGEWEAEDETSDIIQKLDENSSESAFEGLWILDQYRIERLLGEGGMGKVFLAEQPTMDRMAAVKILQVKTLKDPSQVERFRQEARASSRLAHPNIIAVYNFGELSDGSLFLAMEYVDGTPLSEVLNRGALPLPICVEMARQCVEALSYAHHNGVIHRDIKPENIMVTGPDDDPTIKLVDFGLARLVDTGSVTAAGQVLGTPRYMSPEQCRGELLTPNVDQYSLGLVLYEMLTGQPAMMADNIISYLMLHQSFTPKSPSSVRPVPGMELMDPLVARMVAKNPKERYAEEQLIRELNRLVERLGTGEHESIVTSPFSAILQASSVALLDGAEALAHIGDGEAPSGEQISVTQRGSIDTIVDERGDRVLRNCGIHLSSSLPSPDPDDEPLGPPISVITFSAEDGRKAWEAWESGAETTNRTLAFVDAPAQTPGLVELTESFDHMLIGHAPVDPLALYIALKWIGYPQSGAIDWMNLSGRMAARTHQVVSPDKKSEYLGRLLDDLKAQNVRSRARRALSELCGEMVMNAIFHAPTDAHGQPKYTHLDRDTRLMLSVEEEASLSWAIGKHWIALSVRDSFGSLRPRDILRHITEGSRQPTLVGTRGSAGMGLRMMARAAQHLFFFVSPGNWCEILALVERTPSSESRDHSTIGILTHGGQKHERLGKELNMVETVANGYTQLAIRGIVDETCDLRRIYMMGTAVHLDLSQVTQVNSGGVRTWIEAYQNRDPEVSILFEKCSPAVVSQINMVSIFSEHHEIRSILGPYYCPECDQESLREMTVDEIRSGVPPRHACNECQVELEFDELPEEYFLFAIED